MDHILSLLSETVPKARTLEELTRPLLALLGQVTGMESTYLTTINTDEGIQRVEFARNVGSMVIPEGLVVPWADTLCKRALEEKRLYSDNVAECWGDSEAAAALGIKTYLSAPICSHDGRVLGTVCAASSAQVARSADVEPLLMLMSGLLSYSLERELLVERLQAANAELAKLALTDSLTGLSNRRAILSEFNRLFAQAQREQKYVLVAVIDLMVSRASTTPTATRRATSCCGAWPLSCRPACVPATSSGVRAATSSWSSPSAQLPSPQIRMACNRPPGCFRSAWPRRQSGCSSWARGWATSITPAPASVWRLSLRRAFLLKTR